MKTEKISINLNPVELGQIDYLVSRGLFDSRSDFMRNAARKSLEGYSSEFTHFIQQEDNGKQTLSGVGIINLSKGDIIRLQSTGKKLRIRIIGILAIGTSVTADDVRNVVGCCKVHGKIVADVEIKKILNALTDE
ncbi:MAG: hypothetical protein FWE33_00965 [Defluviitaleaceae bacterium]|nr:hypothetical protein [Defluviitaleaceae bacterium]